MRTDKPAYILDSFAVLAYFNDEPGKKRVVELLESADAGKCRIGLSMINFGEVLYIVERGRGFSNAQKAQLMLESLPIELIEVTRNIILDAAHIKATHAMSYADAFAVTTAKQAQAILLTGDTEFKSVEGIVNLEWIDKPARGHE